MVPDTMAFLRMAIITHLLSINNYISDQDLPHTLLDCYLNLSGDDI